MLSKISTKDSRITFGSNVGALRSQVIKPCKNTLLTQIEAFSKTQQPVATSRNRKTLRHIKIIVLSLINKLPIKISKYDTPEIKQARQEVLDYGHNLPTTIEINSPERQALRTNIIQKLLNDPQYINKERNLYLVMGLSGAVKSTLSKDIAQNMKALHLDVDAICFEIPEFKTNPKLSYIVGNEAGMIRDEVLNTAMQKSYNIILEDLGTNKKRILKLLKEMKANNYMVNLVLIDLPSNKSTQRAISRFEETKRFSDPISNQFRGGKPLRTYQSLITSFGEYIKSYSHYSSDVPKGEPFKFISGSGEDILKR